MDFVPYVFAILLALRVKLKNQKKHPMLVVRVNGEGFLMVAISALGVKWKPEP